MSKKAVSIRQVDKGTVAVAVFLFVLVHGDKLPITICNHPWELRAIATYRKIKSNSP